MTDANKSQRLLSGNRATGRLHLGNYFGALQNWVNLQDQYHCFFMVADWHALTSDYANTSELRNYIDEMLLDWLSIGLDPQRSTIFIQSLVKQHAELALLLGMYTPLAWLERNPTYKEQIAQLSNKDLSNFGFLGYPVLQAADIIVYRAHVVPIGEDQLPHLELTREIVRRVHYMLGIQEEPIFPEPKPILSPAPKVLGYDGRKMSKSYDNCIYISDSEKDVNGKVRQMVTDPARVRRSDPGNPEVCSVFDLHKLVTDEPQLSEIDKGCRTAGIGCIDCKKIMAANLNRIMDPWRERRAELEKDPEQIREAVDRGCGQARAAAEATMQVVRDKMNLINRL